MKTNVINNPNGLKRYGFEFWLRKKFKIPFFFKNYVNWEHGWEFQEFDCQNLTIYRTWLNRNMKNVVSSKKKKKKLEDLGFENIYVAPYPFYFFFNNFFENEFKNLYGKEYNKKEKFLEASLLVMPNKIQAFTNKDEQRKRILKYLEYIEAIKKDFEKISICIIPDDKKSEIWEEMIEKFDFDFIKGVSPYDGNGYFRLINTFKNYNYVTSDCIGSHALYANLMKKKFSICMAVDGVSRNINKIVVPKNSPITRKKLIEDLEYSYSKDYLKKHFSFLIKSKPMDGSNYYNWAFENIGENKKISDFELKILLDYKYKNQLSELFKKIL